MARGDRPGQEVLDCTSRLPVATTRLNAFARAGRLTWTVSLAMLD